MMRTGPEAGSCGPLAVTWRRLGRSNIVENATLRVTACGCRSIGRIGVSPRPSSTLRTSWCCQAPRPSTEAASTSACVVKGSAASLNDHPPPTALTGVRSGRSTVPLPCTAFTSSSRVRGSARKGAT